VQRKRVLIIDDEDDIREVAGATLELTEDWEVLTASSGARGLAEARASQPDAILLDVMMPDMDGPATLAALQHDAGTSQIPVIFLTAKVQAADRRRFTQLGIRGVIGKAVRSAHARAAGEGDCGVVNGRAAVQLAVECCSAAAADVMTGMNSKSTISAQCAAHVRRSSSSSHCMT
jgi:CheY-like chemotaxis protein